MFKENSKSFRAIKRKRDNLEDVIYYEAVARDTDSILGLVKLSELEKETYFQAFIDKLKLEEDALKKTSTSKSGSSAENIEPDEFSIDACADRHLSCGVLSPQE